MKSLGHYHVCRHSMRLRLLKELPEVLWEVLKACSEELRH